MQRLLLVPFFPHTEQCFVPGGQVPTLHSGFRQIRLDSTEFKDSAWVDVGSSSGSSKYFSWSKLMELTRRHLYRRWKTLSPVKKEKRHASKSINEGFLSQKPLAFDHWYNITRFCLQIREWVFAFTRTINYFMNIKRAPYHEIAQCLPSLLYSIVQFLLLFRPSPGATPVPTTDTTIDPAVITPTEPPPAPTPEDENMRRTYGMCSSCDWLRCCCSKWKCYRNDCRRWEGVETQLLVTFRQSSADCRGIHQNTILPPPHPTRFLK